MVTRVGLFVQGMSSRILLYSTVLVEILAAHVNITEDY